MIEIKVSKPSDTLPVQTGCRMENGERIKWEEWLIIKMREVNIDNII